MHIAYSYILLLPILRSLLLFEAFYHFFFIPLYARKAMTRMARAKMM